ncbi:hypothetical protein ACFX2I_022466 [Malus domestica]
MRSLFPNLPIISSPAEILANNENLLTPILLWLYFVSNACASIRSLLSLTPHTFKNPYPNVSAFFNTTMQQFYCISIQNNENTSRSPSKPSNFI